MADSDIILAVKSAPEQRLLSQIQRAGIGAVELYLADEWLARWQDIARLCLKFPFRYCLHAPTSGYSPVPLAKLAKAIGAEILVWHNILWDDEWARVNRLFAKSKARLCVENTYSVHEPAKFIRRYGMSGCLDLEHLQLECCGVYEDEFVRVIRYAGHIHLTGYVFGSRKWHTHLHHSPAHSRYMLGLLRKAGYRGFVVSEARQSLQVYAEFKKLKIFFEKWAGTCHETNRRTGRA